MTDQSKQSSVGLSPVQMRSVFPFHLSVDQDLKVVQYGRSLAILIPEIRVGEPIESFLTLRRPQGAWSEAASGHSLDLLYVAEYVPKKLLLRGQILAATNESGGFSFLCSPWLDGPESLDTLGLKLTDFALHDVSLDLIQVVQAMRIANDDLRRLTEILKGHRSDLQRVNAEVSARNSQLETAKRELEDVQRVADLGGWRYDTVADRLECSDGFARIFGKRSSEIGSTLQDWLVFAHPNDRARVERVIQSQGADRLDLDFRIVRADGRRRYVHLRTRPDPILGAKAVTAGTLQDITRRKLAEKILRSQRRQIRKLALVASATDNGVLITDANGCIEWANAAFRRQTGFKPKDLRGKKPGDLLQVPETSRATIQYMREKLGVGEGFSVEILNAGAQGQRYWVSLDVQPIRDSGGATTHFVSVQRDVTETRRQQAALERLRAERDMILELSPDGFLAFDEFGRHVYSNPAAARFVGVETRALEQMCDSDVDDLFARMTADPAAFVSSQRLADGAVDIVQLKKTRITLRRAVREVRGNDGLLRGRVVYLRDITREKELDRMRSEFLATAAHELRTPMSSIHGFSELLMTRELDVPTRREVVETIHSQSNFVVRMVSDLLDLERLSAGAASGEVHILPVVVTTLIQRVLDGLMVEGDPRRVDFLSTADDGVEILADADKLSQALINLLANAYRYSRAKGGKVEVFLQGRRIDQRAQVGITVRDYGIGMSADQVAKVFDRFYRADPSNVVSGTGLGMTLVKEITERMGGAVEVESALGEGTSVTLWLQAAHDA